MPPQQNNQAQSFPPPGQPPEPARSNHERQEDGNVIAVVGFVLAFFVPLAGLICSIIGLKKSKSLAGKNRGLALAGVILSAVFMLLTFIYIVAVVLFAIPAIQVNARNIDRRFDINTIRADISQYASNNRGSLPANKADLESGLTAPLGFFSGIEDGLGNNPYNVYITEASTTVPSSSDKVAGLDVVHIFIGARCVGGNDGISGPLISPDWHYADGGGKIIERSAAQDYAIVTTFEVFGDDGEVECLDGV